MSASAAAVVVAAAVRGAVVTGGLRSAGERQVERVRGVVALGGQIANVRRGQVDPGGDPFVDSNTEPLELGGPVRVVGQQPDPIGAEGEQHLRGGAVVSLVLAAAEGEVRLIR